MHNLKDCKDRVLRGHYQDIVGLQFIDKFGWLRIIELGRLIWPNNANQRKYAERITRNWVKRGLVIERNLSIHAGRAFVLSRKGVSFLQVEGIEARNGKNWGKTESGIWFPTKWWRHDLIVAGILSIAQEKGAKIIPENQIRRENPGIVNIPDGLIITKNNIYWLEVESARKSGDKMNKMVGSLIMIARNEGPILSGVRPNTPAVGFLSNAQDERFFKINHEIRVFEAIKRKALSDIELDLFVCEGTIGVDQFIHKKKQVEADEITRNMKRWDWKKQRDCDGCIVGKSLGLVAEIKPTEDENGLLTWLLIRETFDEFGSEKFEEIEIGGAKTITEAKREIVRYANSSLHTFI
jgi:hypothetical protein